MASDDGIQGSNHMEEQLPFTPEQVAWIDQLVAGRLPPTLQGHGAGDVAGGAAGTPVSASLVTTASQPGESWWWAGGGGGGERNHAVAMKCLRLAFKQESLAEVLAGAMWQTLLTSCSPYPCRVADHAAKRGTIAFTPVIPAVTAGCGLATTTPTAAPNLASGAISHVLSPPTVDFGVVETPSPGCAGVPPRILKKIWALEYVDMWELLPKS